MMEQFYIVFAEAKLVKELIFQITHAEPSSL